MGQLKLFAIVCMATVASTAAAQEQPRKSPGIAPRFVRILQIDRDQSELILSTVTMRFVAEQRTRSVERGGKTEDEVYTVRTPVYEERAESISLHVAQIFDGRGKELTAEEIWKRAEIGAAAVVSADGRKVDPVYLKALAKDTLVIVVPPAANGQEVGDATPNEP
jgi:hypothetical protein